MANRASDPLSVSSSSVPVSFTRESVPEFLRSGWFLSLSSGQVAVGWGELRSVLTPPRGSETCSLYAPDFYLSTEQPWWVTPYWDILDRDRFTTHVLASVAHNVNVEDQRFQWVEPKLEEFRRSWNSIQSGMQNRGLKKAVPVVFGEAHGLLSIEQRLRIIARLARLPLSLHIYGLWGQDKGREFGLIGATPELLFSEHEGVLKTMALAGTRGKNTGPDAAAVLFQDAKERHEHQIVIHDIEEVLSRVGTVTVGETEAVELPTLFHLKTPIEARLHSAPSVGDDLQAMARLLHPTPALGVDPRHLGFEEIRNWGGENRARYGAPFGVDLHSTGTIVRECVVAIRNIQWQDQEIRLGSGCGVVPESEMNREWQELQLKRDSVKRILGV